MICARGHPFDVAFEGACPVCGDTVKVLGQTKTFRVKRSEMVTIHRALEAARILAKAAKEHWPQVEHAEALILRGIEATETIRVRLRYGPRSKKEPKKVQLTC